MLSFITDYGALLLSCCSIFISLSVAVLGFLRWDIDWRRSRKQQRLEFIKDIRKGVSDHNWKFIEHWDFPGVYPSLDELKNVIPNKSDEYKETFGQRVVTLEHLNFLLKIYTNLGILDPDDIKGFHSWALSWYDNSVESLRVIFITGDTYPLDFILWLRNVIFEGKDFSKLLGNSLILRISDYEEGKNKKNRGFRAWFRQLVAK